MKFRIFLAIIFIYQSANAQINTQKYLGTIILENNKPMSFSLDLIEKNGIVSGYSLTNLGTKDETKSEIQGVYFKEDKSFQLHETQIIYTKSEAPINSFCYIRMNLKQKNKFTKKLLEGNFTGNFLDSSECAKGKVLLAEKSIIEKKIKKIEKKIEKKLVKDEIIETKILKDGDNLNINWKAKYLTIKIWDSNQEDGDKINLEINSDVILDNYETKNKAKKIKYKLNEGQNKVIIKATSLGKSPPNTSRIELIDKNKKYPILTQLDLNKSIIIYIKK
tara:strand:- start:120 stop:950 length:831 start_codon:yes stop_codon:yes gene_type:complete